MSCTCGAQAGWAGSCACDAGRPSPAANPAGLTQIAYRANDFAGFRQALLTPLPGEQQLTGWSPDPGDLGLQVLEWWAYLADILTFYNERIANNDYLRTAAAQPGPRRNVAGLARLLGYLPRPGVTATGVVAVVRSTGPVGARLVIPAGTQITSTPAAGAPAQLFETEASDTGEPPTFTGPSDGLITLLPDESLFQPSIAKFAPRSGGVGATVTITGSGLAETIEVTFNSVKAAFIVDSDTQLTASVPAKAGSGHIVVTTPFGTAVSKGKFSGPPSAIVAKPAAPQKSVLLAGKVTVTSGEQLLLIKKNWDGQKDDWAVVTTGATTPEPDPNGAANTRLILSSAAWNALDRAEPPQAADYLLLRTTAAAPLWTVRTPGKKQPTDSESGTITVPLAAVVRSVTPGDNVVFTGSVSNSPDPIQFPAHVIRCREVVTLTRPSPGSGLNTVTNPNIFLPHTELTVRTTASDSSALELAVDDSDLASVTMLYGVREAGTLIATPAHSLDSLSAPVKGPPGLVLPHGSGDVALQDAKGAGLEVKVTLDGSGSLKLALADGTSGALPAPLMAPIRLFADLVGVSRGTTVRDEILGNGDPATPSQAFVLQHSPLIYLPPQKNGDGLQSTLTVRADGVAWQEVFAFAGEAPDATVYVVRELPNGRTQVSFGDGVNGARLPLGVSNVTASYRYGAGGPPPPPGHLTTVLQPQPGLGSVVSPIGINPGTEPESAMHTAGVAPATAVLFGAASAPATSTPLIAPGDWEAFAATVGGVTRARAYWTWDHSRQCPAVTLYIGGEGTDNKQTAANVHADLPRETLRVPLTVRPAHIIALKISCELLAQPGQSQDVVKAAARVALTDARTGLFSPGRMTIGQRLYRSQVQAALASAGAAAIRSLHIGLSDPASQDQAGDDESVPGSRPDGYFSLRPSDLTVHVVSP